MTPRGIVHLCLAGFFGLAVLYVMGKWNTPEWEANPLLPLLAIVVLAGIAGVFLVLVVLPRFGDAVGTVMYSSGEQTTQDDSMKAAALMAQGDYDGAAAIYERMMNDRPDDAYPISEAAKVYAEKLGDPSRAVQVLQVRLEGKEWPEEDAAFLMFRMVDIFVQLKSYDEAKDVLEQIVGNFPGTRHSGNAKHRINEIEQTQFKEISAARLHQRAQG